MSKETAGIVGKALHTISAIAIALIAYFGNGLVSAVEALDQKVDSNTNRLTSIEANRYTVSAAKADQKEVNERVRVLEINRASDSAKLDNIQNQMIAQTQELTRLNAKLENNRGSPWRDAPQPNP